MDSNIEVSYEKREIVLKRIKDNLSKISNKLSNYFIINLDNNGKYILYTLDLDFIINNAKIDESNDLLVGVKGIDFKRNNQFYFENKIVLYIVNKRDKISYIKILNSIEQFTSEKDTIKHKLEKILESNFSKSQKILSFREILVEIAEKVEKSEDKQRINEKFYNVINSAFYKYLSNFRNNKKRINRLSKNKII